MAGRSARSVIVGVDAACTGTIAAGEVGTGDEAAALCLHENDPNASNSRNNAVVCDDRESLIPITSSHDLTEAQLSSADMRMAIQQTGELFRKKTLL
jgi:hypothetical protein